MNYKMIGNFLGRVLVAEAVTMLPALLFSVIDGVDDSFFPLLITIISTIVFAGILLMLGKKAKTEFHAKEGMVCVSLCWFVMSVLGCLPFFISGYIPSFVDALFETVSGFTTTGSTILNDVEALPRSLLYWRSFTHWLGGMGVLVLILIFVNNKKISSGFTMHILRAESPGPSVGKLVPRMNKTVLILYALYLGLTVIDFIFLVAGKMPVFEALCTAIGTAGTGGFGVKNDSIAGYSPYIQNVCTVFMFLFGINFSCYYLLLRGKVKSFFKDEETKFYTLMVVIAALVIAWNIRGVYPTVEETLRHSFFQVAALVSSTGFATADFNLWPTFSRGILMSIMAIGACAGSTGGGFKCIRVILLAKSLKRNLRKNIYPNRVEVIRMNGEPVSEDTITTTTNYLVAYMLLMVISFLIVSIDGFSVSTNFTAVLSCLNNIGPGLDMVGPTGNFSEFSILSKIVLIFDMLAGRLELMPILITLSIPVLDRK